MDSDSEDELELFIQELQQKMNSRKHKRPRVYNIRTKFNFDFHEERKFRLVTFFIINSNFLGY